MNCPHCGAANDEGTNTCTTCGKDMTKDTGGDAGGMGGGDASAGSNM